MIKLIHILLSKKRLIKKSCKKLFSKLKIIDQYILKRYLVTFSVMLLMFIPIGIIIDVSEKVNKMLENKVPFKEIAWYYLDFTIFFANLLFPIFLFLSIIWFTSKLANNTEIIAILSSGISFTRFLRPYLIGATIVSVFSLIMGMYFVPKASAGYWNFRYMYLIGGGREEMRDNSDVYRKISDDEYVFVSSTNAEAKMGFNFSMEKFEGNKLKYKVSANRIMFNPTDSTYTLYGFKKRKIGELNDQIVTAERKDTILNLDFDNLTPVVYVAETLPYTELNEFIEKERKRGSKNIDAYLTVYYKRFAIPISAFILTIIAVSVSSMKRRGGMGMNLAIGIALAFAFVFFDKIFGVLASSSSIPPAIAVFIPNLIFGVLAYYLLRNAKR